MLQVIRVRCPLYITRGIVQFVAIDMVYYFVIIWIFMPRLCHQAVDVVGLPVVTYCQIFGSDVRVIKVTAFMVWITLLAKIQIVKIRMLSNFNSQMHITSK